MAEEHSAQALGPNEWLVDEMYEQYRADPSSVSQSWQEFFADYRRDDEPAAAPPRPHDLGAGDGVGPGARRCEGEPGTGARTGGDGARTAKAATKAEDPDEVAQPLRGAAARIVANMEASLAIPTATSFREVPARLLEVNRSVINGYLSRTRGGKVSFTHLIGFAVVRAITESVPVMNSSYVESDDGKPASRPPQAPGPRSRRRRREERRLAHAVRAGHQERRHP